MAALYHLAPFSLQVSSDDSASCDISRLVCLLSRLLMLN